MLTALDKGPYTCVLWDGSPAGQRSGADVSGAPSPTGPGVRRGRILGLPQVASRKLSLLP